LFSLTVCDLDPTDKTKFKVDQPYLKSFLAIADSLAKEAEGRHKSIFNNGATPLMSQKQLKEFIAKLRAITKKQKAKC